KKILVSNPKESLGEIRIGIDGLIVEKGFFRGLLLPQVALENDMDEIEFISNTCLKAGIHPKSWVEKDCNIYRFQGQIFSSD
ncbi:MAG: AMMECR1 family protein, partial [archaeon]|nr:AMMECR1 family protein [archaeon]